jgi:hypothetical protein
MRRLRHLTSINADAAGRVHQGSMAKVPTNASSAYVAQRLRAHARLCLQVALECPSAGAAGEFVRLADHCSRTANELAQLVRAAESPRYH